MSCKNEEEENQKKCAGVWMSQSINNKPLSSDQQGARRGESRAIAVVEAFFTQQKEEGLTFTHTSGLLL